MERIYEISSLRDIIPRVLAGIFYDLEHEIYDKG